MRSLLFPPLLFVSALALAQPAETPAVSEKPPEVILLDDSVEPEVVIRQRDGDTIEEYRINGRLYKIRVIPLRGEPYILVDHRGDGAFLPHDGPGTPGLSVPQWVIGTF